MKDEHHLFLYDLDGNSIYIDGYKNERAAFLATKKAHWPGHNNYGLCIMCFDVYGSLCPVSLYGIPNSQKIKMIDNIKNKYDFKTLASIIEYCPSRFELMDFS